MNNWREEQIAFEFLGETQARVCFDVGVYAVLEEAVMELSLEIKERTAGAVSIRADHQSFCRGIINIDRNPLREIEADSLFEAVMDLCKLITEAKLPLPSAT